jgi:hypothetical protein
MFSPDQIEALRIQSGQIISPVIEFLISDIASRIAEAGQLTSTAAYQIWRAQNLGISQKKLQKELQKRLKVSKSQLQTLLKQAAEVGYDFDISRFPTVEAIPFDENESLQRIVETAANMTQESFENLTQTMGFVTYDGKVTGLTEAYRKSCDFAFEKIFTGAQDYSSAIRQATKGLAEKGIQTIDYESGVHRSLEAAVRGSFMGGLGIMQEEISQQNHDDLGCDGWEISAHAGSAPDHEPYQGKQYSDAEFTRLNNSLKRRIGTLNCGHSAMPIIMGINDPQYTPEELAEMKRENAEGITYEDGKHYTLYEATQRQRGLERTLRKQKRKILIDEKTGDKEKLAIDQTRYVVANYEYHRFSKAAGLRLQHERANVPGFGTKQHSAALQKSRRTIHKLGDSEHLEFVAASNISDAISFAEDVLGVEAGNVYPQSINLDVANGVNKAIFDISTDLGSLTEYGWLNGVTVSRSKAGPYAQYDPSDKTVILNRVASSENAIELMTEDAKYQFEMGGWSSASPMHSVYHELGHAARYMLIDENPILENKIKVLYNKTYRDILKTNKWTMRSDMLDKFGAMAKNAGFSYYGLRNESEFVAEAIAQYYCSENPGKIAREVMEILKGG